MSSFAKRIDFVEAVDNIAENVSARGKYFN
jgi:hypothetical protein